MRVATGQLPPPTAFGLPEKFNSWRWGQEDAVLHLKDSKKRIVVQLQPTGSGKSVCYVVGSALSNRAVILTSTKGLQSQLQKDFPGTVAVVMGKNAYQCKLYNYQYNCETGPCNYGKYCPVKKECEYYLAIQRAKEARLVATNYAFWVTNKKDTLGEFELLVCDEAHDSLTQVCDSLSVEITQDNIAKCRLTDLYWPKEDEAENLWVWASLVYATLKIKIEDMKVESGIDACLKDKNFKTWHRLKIKLERLSEVDRSLWVAEHNKKSITFDPIWPGKLVDKYLFRDAKKVLLTSATVTKKILELLGVKDNDTDFKEYDSQFPINRRPVMWIPTCRVDYKMTDYDMILWLTRIEQIIRPRLDRKGIIHTVSYNRCQRILNTSEFAEHMITHKSGGRDQAVKEFKNVSAPAILVSPSVTTGFDFAYDECRYQIIGKIPFPDQRRKVDKERKKIDPMFGMNLAAQDLVQTVGRGMRAKDDFCETFIVDDHAAWFVFGKKNRELFPGDFIEACQKLQTIPTPIEY